MNVTTEFNNKRASMGGSGSSRQAYLSVNKNLNLSTAGNSINTASQQRVTAIPVALSMKDSVGLFGPENKFIKLDVDILSSISISSGSETVENTYEAADQRQEPSLVNDFFTADTNYNLDLTTIESYEPAELDAGLSDYGRPVVSISLLNLKTGNRFVDNWVDVTLYGPNKQPVEFEKIYIDADSEVYIGIHARNTKRLPYNIQVVVGKEYLDYSELTSEQLKAFF